MFKFIWNKKLNCYCAEHNPSIRADKNRNVFGGGTTKTETGGTTTPTPTAEETELNRLQLEQMRAIQPGAIGIQQKAFDLGQLLLTGQPLPGYLGALPGGISPDVTQNIVNQSLRDLAVQSQAMGLPVESGTYQSIAGRTTGDIRMASEEFNLGQLLNLLNLAVGGQAQIQAPTISTAGTLGQRLAGLRTVTTTGYGQQTDPWYTQASGAMSAIGQGAGMLGGVMGAFCWVAKEIFGSWEHPKTIMARYYISNLAPKWFKNFYLKYGERIAKFIHNKPILKLILRPLFEMFAYIGYRRAICHNLVY